MGRPKSSTESKIKKGRGTGHGENYQPFLTVRDVPSLGKVSRPKGWKTGRVHHLFSTHELNYFYILEWAPCVVDIREQYPLLPLDATLEIADRLGIRHPVNPTTKKVEVMTTDFLIDEMVGGRRVEKARAIKPYTELGGKRVVEKLEIERTYWAERGRDWGLVTEKEIPKALSGNIEWIHDALSLEIGDDTLRQVERSLYQMICGHPTEALSSLALSVDDALGLEAGRSLWTARHLIATGQWKVNMLAEIKPTDPITVSRVCP